MAWFVTQVGDPVLVQDNDKDPLGMQEPTEELKLQYPQVHPAKLAQFEQEFNEEQPPDGHDPPVQD